jgi:1-acyl-sn-glycerol-3-phosphate acyltransferase
MTMLRSLLFYLGYSLATLVWGTLSVLIGWVLPSRPRFLFIIGAWTRICLWWLKVTCGIRHEITGREHIPDQPCVVLCRHESTWETLFLQTLLAPQATIIKRELLWIPFFGWAFALNKPIAIDRGTPRSALKRLITVGKARLAEKIWVVLFPEGTRKPSDEIGRFQIGGAALASAAEAPVMVIAHNAGDHWPAHELRKRPGTIHVRIMPPFQTIGRDSKSIIAEAEAVMSEGQSSLTRV